MWWYKKRYWWSRHIYDWYGYIIGEVYYDDWYDEYVFDYDSGYTHRSYYLYPY